MKKLVVAIGLLLCGLAVFVLGSPHYRIFATNRNQQYYVALTAVFLVAFLALRKSRTLARYAPPAYALFIASAALLFLSTGILNIHATPADDLQELALDKLSQFLHVVPVILALTLLVGDDLKSIFISRGNLKAGLIFGGVSFVLWAVAAYLVQMGATGFPALNTRSVGLILLFIFANSIMEELWFRAIFLKRYAGVIGRLSAILVTAVPFGASHVNATYEFPGGGVVYGVVVFILGLVGAYAMLKDDSLLGPVLFHAGYDLMIIVPVLNSM
ncbi:MAG: lysostaphin resistance A-like protein [Anaerolineae bacterium]|jgi:membrane protease YdiL (CAAX protease family)